MLRAFSISSIIFSPPFYIFNITEIGYSVNYKKRAHKATYVLALWAFCIYNIICNEITAYRTFHQVYLIPKYLPSSDIRLLTS